MYDPLTEATQASHTALHNTAIAAALGGLNRILGAGFELSSWDITINEDNVGLNLGRVIYHRGEGETEFQSVSFTFEELIDPGLDLAGLAKQRWDESKEAVRQMLQRETEHREAEQKRQAALKAAESKQTKQERAAALAAAEAKSPEVVAALRAAGLL